MDKLDEIKREYDSKLKKLALLNAGMDFNEVDAYIKYITADNEQEIEQQALELSEDISAHNTAYFGDAYRDPRSNTISIF